MHIPYYGLQAKNIFENTIADVKAKIRTIREASRKYRILKSTATRA